MTRVGLISDTHGWLDPRAARALADAGVSAIVHAGDIGEDPGVLWELNAIAPVTAVLGNCDWRVPGFDLGGIARITAAGVRILVIHDFADLGEVSDDVDLVVRGHSHRPGEMWQGSTRVLNPGSATQRRQMPSCSVATLEIAQDGADPVFTVIWLDELGPRIR